MRTIVPIIFLCLFAVSCGGGGAPIEGNESEEAVHEETIEAQSELDQMNREVKQKGKEQAQEILERLEEN